MAGPWPDPHLAKRGAPTKSVDARREYIPLTWEWFLQLRAWAQWASVEVGAPIYLVGSALDHDAPRDVDVAIIWPLDRFEQLFGPVPTEDDPAIWTAFWAQEMLLHGAGMVTVSAWHGVGYKPYLDIKFCPDVWFLAAPRLLLGSPENSVLQTDSVKGEPFEIHSAVRCRQQPDGLLTNEVERVLFDPAWLKKNAGTSPH